MNIFILQLINVVIEHHFIIEIENKIIENKFDILLIPPYKRCNEVSLYT